MALFPALLLGGLVVLSAATNIDHPQLESKVERVQMVIDYDGRAHQETLARTHGIIDAGGGAEGLAEQALHMTSSSIRESHTSAEGDGFQSEAERRREQRTAVYDAFAKVYEVLRKNNVPIFPRNGFLINVVRDGGFAKWDIDPDMTILDSDCDKLRSAVDAVARTGATMTISSPSGLGACPWRVNYPGLDWPLMDGTALKTTKENLVHFHDDFASMSSGQAQGFPLEDWDSKHEWAKFNFYCLSISVPRGYKAYLTAHYGDEWPKLAVNKCSKPNGPMYRTAVGEEHCRMSCYLGAADMLIASRPGPPARGAIDSKSCSGFKTEQAFSEEDEALASEYAAKLAREYADKSPNWALA